MGDDFAAFIGVSALVIVTPGPDTALTTRNTLVGGRTGGMLTAIGVSTGQAAWALASSAGVLTMLDVSKPAFVIVRGVGAVFLIFLGAQAILGTLAAERCRSRKRNDPPGLPSGRALGQGLVSNLTNPKMAVFFTSFLPQFTLGSRTSFWGLLFPGLLFSLLTLVWLIGYACTVAKAGDFLRRPRVKCFVERVTGSALIALGLRLVTEL